MNKNILLVSVILITHTTIFCMHNSGKQELAKHKVDFQAGMKKLLGQFPEDLPPDDYTPRTRECVMQKNKETRKIAKELEAAFNSIFTIQEESQAIPVQNIEKPIAALKKLWEQICPINPEACMAACSFSNDDIAQYAPVAKKNAQLFQDIVKGLEAAFAQRDELIAQLQMQGSSQQSVSLQEHQSLANNLAQVRTQLAEKTRATYDLAAANSAKESAITSLEAQLKEKKQEIAELKKRDANESRKFQEYRDRIISMLALFEASKTTGWEVAFIQTLKTELGKQ